ncbi:MarR family winged helix-turn-helix transcriptional regulator [Occultella kanbiaonis]|uniref:MarR family winged helix-turn-helix transcriptional regulator n=1 Tax=Occultella kanbiaonis TaxID=2675754 RepID=UPI0013D81FCA|nr:MarR family winged helix-turn-helix transcriptional regulator [Occultella kanbiaonis]
MTNPRGREPERAPESDPSDLLTHATRALRRRWAASLGPWGLAPHEARALRVISDSDGARLSDIAAHLRIAPRSATEVVDALQEKSLVERMPDPTDRRAVLAVPTDTGRALAEEIGAARLQVSRDYFSRLEPQEQDQLAALLHRLIAD